MASNAKACVCGLTNHKRKNSLLCKFNKKSKVFDKSLFDAYEKKSKQNDGQIQKVNSREGQVKCYLDTESTGFSRETDRIIQIAIIVEYQNLTRVFSSKVNIPDNVNIHPKASEQHHIDKQDLQGEPYFNYIYERIYAIFSSVYQHVISTDESLKENVTIEVIAYKCEFDIEMLESELIRLGKSYKSLFDKYKSVIVNDTLVTVRRLKKAFIVPFGDLPSCKLGVVYKHVIKKDITGNLHDALTDTKLLKEIAELDIIKTNNETRQYESYAKRLTDRRLERAIRAPNSYNSDEDLGPEFIESDDEFDERVEPPFVASGTWTTGVENTPRPHPFTPKRREGFHFDHDFRKHAMDPYSVWETVRRPLRQITLKQTNLYIRQKSAAKTIAHFLKCIVMLGQEKFKDLNKRGLLKLTKYHSIQLTMFDIMAYEIIILYNGFLKNRTNYRDWFSSDPLKENAITKLLLPRTRFEFIKANIHFANNYIPQNSKADFRKKDRYDPLYKIRTYIDTVKRIINDLYEAGEQVAIDEKICSFCGRTVHRQVCPNKNQDTGYKIYLCCDSKTKIPINWFIYINDWERIEGFNCVAPDLTYKSEKAVVYLSKCISGTGRSIYLDRGFMTVLLCIFLYKYYKLNSCGPTKQNSHGTCKAIKSKKKKPDKVEIGNMHYATYKESDMEIGSLTYADSIWVMFVTTVTSVLGTLRINTKRTGKEVYSPEVREDYMTYISAVDDIDQSMSYMKSGLKQMQKWYICLINLFGIDIMWFFVSTLWENRMEDAYKHLELKYSKPKRRDIILSIVRGFIRKHSEQLDPRMKKYGNGGSDYTDTIDKMMRTLHEKQKLNAASENVLDIVIPQTESSRYARRVLNDLNNTLAEYSNEKEEQRTDISKKRRMSKHARLLKESKSFTEAMDKNSYRAIIGKIAVPGHEGKQYNVDEIQTLHPLYHIVEDLRNITETKKTSDTRKLCLGCKKRTNSVCVTCYKAPLCSITCFNSYHKGLIEPYKPMGYAAMNSVQRERKRMKSKKKSLSGKKKLNFTETPISL